VLPFFFFFAHSEDFVFCNWYMLIIKTYKKEKLIYLPFFFGCSSCAMFSSPSSFHLFIYVWCCIYCLSSIKKENPQKTNFVWCYIILYVCIFFVLFFVHICKRRSIRALRKNEEESLPSGWKSVIFFLFSVVAIIIITDLPISCLSL